jgi:hypothetical protein
MIQPRGEHLVKSSIAVHRPGLVVRWIGCVGLLAAAAAGGSGCSQGEAVTADSLDAAKAVWARAGIRDYELEWKAAGRNNAHYVVTVSNGAVAAIESVTPKGERVAVHPAETRFYSVDGLFLTIADELAQLKTDQPFGQPPGSKVVMRVYFDPKLGYPISYHRDVLGTTQGLAIDVIHLTPKA